MTFFSGFLFAIANVASITAMIFFHIIDLFHPRSQQLCKFLREKEGFYIRKEFNPHMIFSVDQHGRCLIVLYTNMAAVTLYEGGP